MLISLSRRTIDSGWNWTLDEFNILFSKFSAKFRDLTFFLNGLRTAERTDGDKSGAKKRGHDVDPREIVGWRPERDDGIQ